MLVPIASSTAGIKAHVLVPARVVTLAHTGTDTGARTRTRTSASTGGELLALCHDYARGSDIVTLGFNSAQLRSGLWHEACPHRTSGAPSRRSCGMGRDSA